MTINAGVWIDHHKAVVVLLRDKTQEVLQVDCEIDDSTHIPGDAPGNHAYTPKDFVAEDKLERKTMIRLNRYYDKVITHVRDADSILILGPGEAKGEFVKRIERAKLKGNVTEVQTVDKLTDPQIAAHVRQHFQEA
jgi:hypothetical protein